MHSSKTFTYLIQALLIFLVIISFYRAWTTVPVELDSVTYHIPIAKGLLNGSSWTTSLPFAGTTHIILAGIIFLHLPVTMFNVLGFMFLILSSAWLAKRAKLPEPVPYLYALIIATLPTVIRLIPFQTSDIWMAVFFQYAFGLLLQPEKTIRYALFVGTALGLLIGAKLYGPIYTVILLAFYGLPAVKKLRWLSLVAFIPILVFGFSWFIRNTIVLGSPIYPSGFLWFPGKSGLYSDIWPHYKTMFSSMTKALWFINAGISEYLIWSVAPIILLISYIKRVPQRIGILGFVLLFAFWFLPGAPHAYQNIVSEMRYAQIAFCVIILACFIAFYKPQNLFLFLIIGILDFAITLTFIPYVPKVFVIAAITSSVYLYGKIRNQLR